LVGLLLLVAFALVTAGGAVGARYLQRVVRPGGPDVCGRLDPVPPELRRFTEGARRSRTDPLPDNSRSGGCDWVRSGQDVAQVRQIVYRRTSDAEAAYGSWGLNLAFGSGTETGVEGIGDEALVIVSDDGDRQVVYEAVVRAGRTILRMTFRAADAPPPADEPATRIAPDVRAVGRAVVDDH
jgi:hypothetical protein